MLKDSCDARMDLIWRRRRGEAEKQENEEKESVQGLRDALLRASLIFLCIVFKTLPFLPLKSARL